MAGKSMKPGGGGRFAKLTKALKAKGTKRSKAKGAKNPKALAAWIGRKKYGEAKMARMAAAGRRRAARRK